MFVLLNLIFKQFQARVNIPGLSERTIRRSISDSGVLLSSQIQVSRYSESAFPSCVLVCDYIVNFMTDNCIG